MASPWIGAEQSEQSGTAVRHQALAQGLWTPTPAKASPGSIRMQPYQHSLEETSEEDRWVHSSAAGECIKQAEQQHWALRGWKEWGRNTEAGKRLPCCSSLYPRFYVLIFLRFFCMTDKSEKSSPSFPQLPDILHTSRTASSPPCPSLSAPTCSPKASPSHCSSQQSCRTFC